MELKDRVKEFMIEKCQMLSTGFYADTLSRLDEIEEEQEHAIESPIEQLFWIEWQFRQFANTDYGYFYLNAQYQDESTGKFRLDFSVDFIQDAYENSIGKDYDEIILSMEPPKLGIEIDSHIWHEKTKEQAQRDKKRERFLISNGWKLVRFSGSEVYKDPFKCVHETLEISSPMRTEYYKKVIKKYKEKLKK